MATTYDNNTKDASGKSINDYKTAYAEAAARGDAAGMKAANDAANAIRTANGGAAEVAHDAISKVAGGKTYSVEQQRSMGFDTGNAGRTGSTGAARANAAAGSSSSPTLESYSDPHTYVPSGNVSASIKTQDPSVVMRRNPALAGQTVHINGYNVTFNEDGYARSAVNVDKTGAQKAQSLEAAYGTDRSGYGGSDKDKYYFSDAELQDADYWRQQAQAGNISWAQANDMVNRMRNKYGYAEYYSTGGNETDYSALIKEAIRSGADADAVAGLIAQRNAKIDGNPALEQYRNDDTYRLAMDYISTQQAAQQKSQLEDYLREAYLSNTQAALARLKSAYERGLAGYDAQAEGLGGLYDAARNRAAAQSALERMNFNEQAAASGLNSGTSGQAELARAAAQQSTLAGIDKAQADAQLQIDLAKSQLTSDYENAAAEAQASGDSQLAQALYQEMLRQEAENDAALEQRLAAAQSAAKPALTAAQTLAALESGVVNDTTLAAYEYYYGQPYAAAYTANTAPAYYSAQPRGVSYNNGGLTSDQVRQLQGLLGVTQDGFWGPATQAAANAMWGTTDADTAYRTAGVVTPYENSVTSGSKSNLDYDQDEGVFTWNGRRYNSLTSLLSALNSVSMTQAEIDSITRKLNAYGFSAT